MGDDIYYATDDEAYAALDDDVASDAAKDEQAKNPVRASYPDRLMAANSSMRFTNIKGKEYAEVNQRILAFWSLFPDGRIKTEKVFDDGNRCDFIATVYRSPDEDLPAATGHAYEMKGGGVNSTSYVENCETSAVGRALGMLGIGATNAIASADEVLAAMSAPASSKQPKQPPADGPFVARCKSCGMQYQFQSADQYRQFIANSGCCPNPQWEVV